MITSPPSHWIGCISSPRKIIASTAVSSGSKVLTIEVLAGPSRAMPLVRQKTGITVLTVASPIMYSQLPPCGTITPPRSRTTTHIVSIVPVIMVALARPLSGWCFTMRLLSMK